MSTGRLVVAGLWVGVLVTAGCLGTVGSQSDLGVTDFDAEWTEAGTLSVQVTVTNAGDAGGTGVLLVEARIEDAGTYSERRELTLEPGQSETVVVEIEPPGDAAGSSYDVRARVE